jgi:hypothetical protein
VLKRREVDADVRVVSARSHRPSWLLAIAAERIPTAPRGDGRLGHFGLQQDRRASADCDL